MAGPSTCAVLSRVVGLSKWSTMMAPLVAPPSTWLETLSGVASGDQSPLSTVHRIGRQPGSAAIDYLRSAGYRLLTITELLTAQA